MNVMPVAAFLKDFSSYVPEVVELGPEPQPEIIDNSEAIEAARAEGVAQGREEAMAEMTERLAAQDAAFEERLKAEREAWAAHHAGRLAAAMLQGLDGLRDDVISATAQVLKPFVADRIREKALVELRHAIDDMLLRDPEIGFVISGPADLVKELEVHLSEKAGSFSFRPSESAELEVKAGAALLSTRISSWLEKINEA